jgi:hypothetical protein
LSRCPFEHKRRRASDPGPAHTFQISSSVHLPFAEYG